MSYFLIIVLSILSVFKVTIQGKFSKLFVKESLDILAFLSGSFFMISLMLFIIFGTKNLSLETVIYGVVLGSLTTCFQLFYTKAMKNGPVSITSLVANMQTILPTLFSAIVYGDEFGVVKVLGVVFLLLAMLLLLRPKNGDKTKTWIFLVIITFFAGGFASIVQKIQGESKFSSQKNQMLLFCYLTAGVLCAIIVLISRIKGKKTTFNLGIKPLGFMLGISTTLCAYQVLLVYLISIVAGTILYPLHNVTVVLLTAVMGFTLFKEKFDKFSLLGIVVSACSILCLVL